MKINVQENQTIRDIAVKYYGTYEAIGEILELNPHIRNNSVNSTFSLDKAIVEGMEIVIDKASFMERTNITRELVNNEINTYDDGTNS